MIDAGTSFTSNERETPEATHGARGAFSPSPRPLWPSAGALWPSGELPARPPLLPATTAAGPHYSPPRSRARPTGPVGASHQNRRTDGHRARPTGGRTRWSAPRGRDRNRHTRALASANVTLVAFERHGAPSDGCLSSPKSTPANAPTRPAPAEPEPARGQWHPMMQVCGPDRPALAATRVTFDRRSRRARCPPGRRSS